MNELSKTLAGEISGFSNAIKNLAPHIYQVYVRQQIISSICYMICWVLGSIICFYFGRLLFKTGQEQNDSLFKNWGIFICIVAGFMVVIAAVANIPSIINPEYYAIKDLIEHFTGK